MFADQDIIVDDQGKKLRPTILDKILKKKKVNEKHVCVYQSDNTDCLISKYIWENKSDECVILPDICNCGSKCPYFTKYKE